MSQSHTFLLRLPNSIREEAAAIAKQEGTSLNHFISIALAEKLVQLKKVEPVKRVPSPFHSLEDRRRMA